MISIRASVTGSAGILPARESLEMRFGLLFVEPSRQDGFGAYLLIVPCSSCMGRHGRCVGMTGPSLEEERADESVPPLILLLTCRPTA